MAMTVQNLRDYVRNVLEVDDQELMDSLLDTWRDEGYNRILTAFEAWSFFDESLSATTSNSIIPFSALLDANNNAIDHVEEVFLVSSSATWKMSYIPYRDGLVKFGGLGTTASTFPEAYSIFASQIFIWPTNNSTLSFTIIGRRAPKTMSVATDTPDMPAVFHPLIGEWMLARSYEFQDDEVMSTQKFQRFEQQLNSMHRRFTRPPNAGVMAIGENHDYEVPGVSQRLRYSWE